MSRRLIPRSMGGGYQRLPVARRLDHGTGRSGCSDRTLSTSAPAAMSRRASSKRGAVPRTTAIACAISHSPSLRQSRPSHAVASIAALPFSPTVTATLPPPLIQEHASRTWSRRSSRDLQGQLAANGEEAGSYRHCRRAERIDRLGRPHDARPAAVAQEPEAESLDHGPAGPSRPRPGGPDRRGEDQSSPEPPRARRPPWPACSGASICHGSAGGPTRLRPGRRRILASRAR